MSFRCFSLLSLLYLSSPDKSRKLALKSPTSVPSLICLSLLPPPAPPAEPLPPTKSPSLLFARARSLEAAGDDVMATKAYLSALRSLPPSPAVSPPPATPEELLISNFCPPPTPDLLWGALASTYTRLRMFEPSWKVRARNRASERKTERAQTACAQTPTPTTNANG